MRQARACLTSCARRTRGGELNGELGFGDERDLKDEELKAFKRGEGCDA
jgi:hypothetical protein